MLIRFIILFLTGTLFVVGLAYALPPSSDPINKNLNQEPRAPSLSTENSHHIPAGGKKLYT